MSGVYIPGMEKPETCKACFLSEFDAGFYAYICRPTGIRIDYEMAKIARPQRICPLIPVPEHGDLIERDALSKRIKEETINQAEFYADRWHPVVLAYGDCYGKVQNAPTIIPADKEGEG